MFKEFRFIDINYILSNYKRVKILFKIFPLEFISILAIRQFNLHQLTQ
jgi:hypothetical protein